MLGTSGCRILSLTTEFKYSPSQCRKGHVCAIGYVSDQKPPAPEDLLGSPEDLVKVACNWLGRMPLPLGTQEGSGKGACLCQETGPERHVCAIVSVSDQKPPATEDLVRVTCNRLGRMPLPLGTQEGSFGADKCFSLRQRSMSLPRDRN